VATHERPKNDSIDAICKKDSSDIGYKLWRNSGIPDVAYNINHRRTVDQYRTKNYTTDELSGTHFVIWDEEIFTF